MDALTYFLFHSFVYNLLLGLTFFAIGLLVGWWIWARWQRRAEEIGLRLQFAQTQLTKLKTEIEPLRGASSQAEAKLAAAEVARAELQTRLDALGSRASRLELERQANARSLDEARETAADATARLAELEAQLRGER